MRIEFCREGDPGRQDIQDHVAGVYKAAYGAKLQSFAPLLVAARAADGQILCAAGIRTSRDSFFSDGYLDAGLSAAIRTRSGIVTPENEIMEVVSLATTTPFPVLGLLDGMIGWGRQNGMSCGVFTATRTLRRLLKRTNLEYLELAAADKSRVADPNSWGTYYDTDPWVCAYHDRPNDPVMLSPRAKGTSLQSEAS